MSTTTGERRRTVTTVMAEQVRTGDRFVAVGLTYQVASVVHDIGTVVIEALLVTQAGSVTVRAHAGRWMDVLR